MLGLLLLVPFDGRQLADSWPLSADHLVLLLDFLDLPLQFADLYVLHLELLLDVSMEVLLDLLGSLGGTTAVVDVATASE